MKFNSQWKPLKSDQTKSCNLSKFAQAVKKLLELDPDGPDAHRCTMLFLHKMDGLPSPVTDSEKLICNVLEAERATLRGLHELPSLIEANKYFLDSHKDSLVHRVVAAEMLYVLAPERKFEAIKLMEDSPESCQSGAIMDWRLKDCITVHTLLENVFVDHAAASRWRNRCSVYFPYSTYFKGPRSSVVQKPVDDNTKTVLANGAAEYYVGGLLDPHPSNGDINSLESLKI